MARSMNSSLAYMKDSLRKMKLSRLIVNAYFAFL